MSTQSHYLIKFKHGDLACLRGKLLEDLSREHFAVLLGKTQKINVHTHPFTQTGISFSSTDDEDEKTFYRFLKKTFDGMHYASIVFSQQKYSARVWTFSN